MIEPLHDQVVVRRLGTDATTASGLVIPDAAREKQGRGVVVAVGPGRRDEDGARVPMDVGVGDEVIFALTAGSELQVNGENLLVIWERDVIAAVEP